MIHDFKASLKQGEKYELLLDEFFLTKYPIQYDIKPATREQQRQGIDRIFTNPMGKVQTVDYKADFRAGATGNLFIEVQSVDERKEGWAKKGGADLILYLIVTRNILLVLESAKIQAILPDWEKKFSKVSCENSSYYSYGLLVPTGVVLKDLKPNVIEVEF